MSARLCLHLLPLVSAACLISPVSPAPPGWLHQRLRFAGLGISLRAWPALLRAIFFDLLPRFRELQAAGPGALPLVAMAAVPPLNRLFQGAIGAMSWDELQPHFAAADLW